MIKKFIATVLASMALAGTAHAVTAEEQQERLMTVYSHLLDFRPSRPAATAPQGTIEAEVEILHMPNVDNRVGIKEEPIDSMPLIPRFRARYFATDFLYAGTGFQFPVEFEGYKYGFLAGELGVVYPIHERVAANVRTYYSDSRITGPVTVADADDEFSARQMGFDANVGLNLRPVYLSAGLGYSKLDSTLDIEEDGVELELEKNYKYVTTNLSYDVADYTRLGVTQNFTDGGILQHWAFNVTQTF